MTTEKIYVGIDNERVEATGQVLQDILNYRAKKKLYKETQQAEAEAKAVIPIPNRAGVLGIARIINS